MKANTKRQPEKFGGFTLTELMVVLAVLAVLAAVLTPALAATKSGGKVAQCLDDKRQLTLAWLMYASDNGDTLVSYSSWISSQYSYLDWTTSSKNFDADYLTNSNYALIAYYIRSAAVFKCPADNYQSPAQIAAGIIRDRSISLNGALTSSGGGPSVDGAAPNGGRFFGSGINGAGSPCTKLTYLSKPGPAATFVFLDEHPDSIDDGIFMFDPGASATSEYWRNLPASYHDGAAGISFADGHTEMHPWQETGGSSPASQKRKTVYPVRFSSPSGQWGNATTFANSVDWSWVNARMPYR